MRVSGAHQAASAGARRVKRTHAHRRKGRTWRLQTGSASFTPRLSLSNAVCRTMLLSDAALAGRRHAATRLALLFLLSLDNSTFPFGLHDAGLQVVDSAHGIVHLFQRDPNSRVHLRCKAKREFKFRCTAVWPCAPPLECQCPCRVHTAREASRMTSPPRAAAQRRLRFAPRALRAQSPLPGLACRRIPGTPPSQPAASTSFQACACRSSNRLSCRCRMRAPTRHRWARQTPEASAPAASLQRSPASLATQAPRRRRETQARRGPATLWSRQIDAPLGQWRQQR